MIVIQPYNDIPFKIRNAEIIRKRSRVLIDLSKKKKQIVEEFADNKKETTFYYQDRGHEYNPINSKRQEIQGGTGESYVCDVLTSFLKYLGSDKIVTFDKRIREGEDKMMFIGPDHPILLPDGRIIPIETKSCGYDICTKLGYSPIFSQKGYTSIQNKSPDLIVAIVSETKPNGEEWSLSWTKLKHVTHRFGEARARRLLGQKACLYLSEDLSEAEWTKDLSDLISNTDNAWIKTINESGLFVPEVNTKELLSAA